MGVLKRMCPATVFFGDGSFQAAPITTPMCAARVIEACLSSLEDAFRLDVFHHLPHCFAWPNTVLAFRRMCEQFAEVKVRGFRPAKLRACVADGLYPFGQPVPG